MNENKDLRLWKWSVILLVVCNIGLILTIWVRPGLLHAHPQPETPRAYVIRNLKFTDEQVKKYDSLITIHRSTMDRLRKETMEYRDQLFNNLRGNGNSSLNPDSLSQLIANDQKQIELVTYNHFAAVKAICTDAQKTDFDRIIGDVTKKMNGNRPGPRPGQPGGGPPPNDRPGPPENE